MRDRNAGEWEELARREQCFPVLTSDGARESAFMESGEEDIALLLSAIASMLGRDVPLNAVFDFGCGAGRLSLPLARRATRVVACDIAPTMLAHAGKNAREAGLSNIAFIETGGLDGLGDDQFDFVCSLLVFQHIRSSEGYKLIRTLLRVLAPGGVAALQVTLEPPGGGVRRLARMLHESRLVSRAVTHIRPPSWMQVNAYDERIVIRDVVGAGALVAGRFATHRDDASGTVLVVQKPARASALLQNGRDLPE